jgi:hypothetical protein
MASQFPTDFAMTIMRDCDLYPKCDIYEIEDIEEKQFWMRMQFLLREFQQMAVFSNLDICMYIYSGVSLDDEQKGQLNLIHKLTKEWTKGQIAAELMASMKSDGRLAPSCGGLLLSHVHGLPGEVKGSDSKTKRLVISTMKKITE